MQKLFYTWSPIWVSSNTPRQGGQTENNSLYALGSFHYTLCCFGLSNSPQSMQRLTDWLTSDLDNFSRLRRWFPCFHSNAGRARITSWQLFQRFPDAGLKITPKSHLGCSEVTFCCYLISEDGTKPPPEKFEAIKNYPEPATVKVLKSFLGAVNFYRSAIPNFAVIDALLKKLLQGKKQRYASLTFAK